MPDLGNAEMRAAKAGFIRRLGRVAAIALVLAVIDPALNLPALARGSAVNDAGDLEPARLAAFEADLAYMFDYLRMAGLAAAILRDRELRWFRGYGHADLAQRTPVTPDTPFHLASLTKTYAATLLLQQVEQGRLDLDAPVASFGIELESPGTVTVRHLFSHTSRGRPGARYRYDGSRFGLLDRVIEQTSGRSFEANVRQIIIAPLDLRNTGRMGDSFAVPLAAPYRLDDDGDLVPGVYPTYFGSSAGLVASVSDYARYLVALHDNRFLRPDTLARAFTPTRSTAGRDLPYGLGWFVESVEGNRVIWHYGYWDSVSTLVVMLPEQDLTFLAFANTDALSRGFDLGRGELTRSPAGLSFLEHFVLDRE